MKVKKAVSGGGPVCIVDLVPTTAPSCGKHMLATTAFPAHLHAKNGVQPVLR